MSFVCPPQTLIVPQGEFYYTFWLNLQLFKKMIFFTFNYNISGSAKTAKK